MRPATSWSRLLAGMVIGLTGLLLLLVIGAAEDDSDGPSLSGVDASKVPKLARQLLPVINDVLDRQCPELPTVWVVAEIQAESSWNPRARSSDSNGGAFGLFQINTRNWVAAGGRPGEITVPETHLRVGIPWVCTNLRAVTGHLKATGKPTDPLDAMLVCHIAGCGRVTGSATGVPRPGEAGCGPTCANLVQRYLATVHRYVEQFSSPPGAVDGRTQPPPPTASVTGPNVRAAAQRPADAGGVMPAVIGGSGPAGTRVTIGGITTAALPLAPAPFPGRVTGCTLSDPTSDGCLTATTRYGLESLGGAFGGYRQGPSVRSAGCWDAHAWNPASDHAKGRACDLFTGGAGKFAQGRELEQGWRVANWYRVNAAALRVRYLIWQGRYWEPGARDSGGWGTRYTGGGVYNVKSATGGHYDHIHVSYRD